MKPPRLRAPREDGALLISPDWGELPTLVETNRKLIAQSSFGLGGKSLGELRHWAKESAQGALAGWYRELGWERCTLQSTLIVTGHQPELFHPGVWAKNVAVSRLARKLSGSSLNINVDSDVAKSTVLTLPVADGSEDHRQYSFSEARPPVPYEEWRCEDEGRFAALPAAVAEVTGQWPWQPVLGEFWAMAAQSRAATIPERWVMARHQWEERLSVSNQELTMSRWCGTEFFHWLVEQFVADGARFASVYNEELKAYRKEHRVRSVNHPVADLLVTPDLVELPFWAWRQGTTQRGRLCIQASDGSKQLVALVAGREEKVSVDFTGWKIRPKALITSMMFRLFVAELFVHGIGGAIYDELTDRIFQRYWDIKLPRFAVVTATLRLPWGRAVVTEDALRQQRALLRRLHWNPDEYVAENVEGAARHLVTEKQRLLQREVPPEELKGRHQQLESIREQLWPVVQGIEERMEGQSVALQQQWKRDEHHFSREQAWVLYSSEKLVELIEKVCCLDF